MRRWFGWKFWLAVLFAAMIASPKIWHTTQPPIIECAALNGIGNVTSAQNVPDDLRALEGKRVIISGWLLQFSTESMRAFLLFDFRDRSSPYGPRPQDRVLVYLVPAATVPGGLDLSELVDVSGTFHIRIERDQDGRINSVFRLDADQISLWVPRDPPPWPMWVPLTRLAGILGMIGVLIVPISLVIGENIIAYRRIKSGNCARCGYDLRATPHRCPECGWSPLERLSDCPDH